MITKKTFCKEKFFTEKRLTNCPFYIMKTHTDMACSLSDKIVICNYEIDHKFPEDCPMRNDSVTQIFFIE